MKSSIGIVREIIRKSLKKVINEQNGSTLVVVQESDVVNAVDGFLNLIYGDETIASILNRNNVSQTNFRSLLLGTAATETGLLTNDGRVVFRYDTSAPAQGVFQITTTCVLQLNNPRTVRTIRNFIRASLDLDTVTLANARNIDEAAIMAGCYYIWTLLNEPDLHGNIADHANRAESWSAHYNREAGVTSASYIRKHDDLNQGQSF